MATGIDKTFLPQEVIVNILKRLPAKSLVQFQLVCKYWKNLFKTPYFIEEHCQFSAQKDPLLIFHAFGCSLRYSTLSLLRYKTESVEIERIKATDSFTHACGIIGSSNGLICVILSYDDDGGSPPSLLLLNPATREVRPVPRTINYYGSYGVYGWGFGFSPLVRDYNIVRIHNARFYFNNGRASLDNSCVEGVEMYSLRTGSWKEVEFGLIKSVRLQYSKPVTANGTIFWLGLEFKDEDHPLIVSFDLAEEVFTLTPIPSSITDPRTYANVLDVYKNKLAMLHGYYSYMSSFMDLWVLEEGSGEYGKSWFWTKKYNIGPTSCSLYPMCSWKNEIVCQNIGSERNGKWEDDPGLYLYNLTTNNELKRFRVSISVDSMNGIFNYVENLVSISDEHVEEALL
ncbi:F-box protein At3g07870-like [Neltuma alba]|uniref:F-box protein At3g07870-like n=1 Tax=Neltuma alba TaxID=207710 RepID=UPI0010A31656|nr:F-box protein At3g07870-like [Prosopis alba]